MRKVIFVLLDACGYEVSKRNLGYIEHLIENEKGAKYKVKGELPSLSKPMYATILTGMEAYKHEVGCNEVMKLLKEESVFSLCKDAGGVTGAAGYYWMSELYNHIPFNPQMDRIQFNSKENINYGIFYWEDEYPDTHVFADGEYIRINYEPNFLLYHTMAIDFWGHKAGEGSKEYEVSVAKVDHDLAYLISQWRQAGYDVVISSDHGMNSYGIHGGTDNIQRDTPLYIFSDLVRVGRYEEQYITQLSIAPMLCKLLGIPVGKQMIKDQEIQFIK